MLAFNVPSRFNSETLVNLGGLIGVRSEPSPILVERVAARGPSIPETLARRLTPVQQAVLHEVAATADLPAAVWFEQVARNLGLPSATLTATLDGLLNLE
jgi:hypothetical protein